MDSIGMVTATSDAKDSLDLTVTITSDAEEGRVSSPSRTASLSDGVLDRSTDQVTAEPTTSSFAPSPAPSGDDAEEVEEVATCIPVASTPVSQKSASPAPELTLATDTVGGQRDGLSHSPQCDRKVILAPEVCCTLVLAIHT